MQAQSASQSAAAAAACRALASAIEHRPRGRDQRGEQEHAERAYPVDHPIPATAERLCHIAHAEHARGHDLHDSRRDEE
jgi:hypothetical protein